MPGTLLGMPSPTPPADRIRELADSLGFVSEADLLLMSQWSPETAAAKRRRGEGPPYVRFGCQYYYPKSQLAHYLRTRVRERVEPAGKDQL